jgi:hypothetical protein
MALVYCVRELISLLAIPENQICVKRYKAIRIVQISNNFIYSPTFILFGGHWFKKKVCEKFSITNIQPNKRNMFMTLPTIFFSDEIIIIITLIVSFILMYNVWLLNWQTELSATAYNQTYTNDAYILSCFYQPYQQCLPCNKAIQVNKSDDFQRDTYTYKIYNNDGCNKVKAICCPLIEKNGVEAIIVALKLNLNIYVDPNSFENDTYMVYTMFGMKNLSSWVGIVCNRIVQAECTKYNVKSKWNIDCTLIIIGNILFYIISSLILHRIHNNMVKVDSISVDEFLNASISHFPMNEISDSSTSTGQEDPVMLEQDLAS